MSLNKFIGSILIVIGTTIGGGILALPLVCAPLGWFFATIVLIVIWMLMTVTGLLVLEVNLSLAPSACSFSSMAGETIGRLGKIVVWLSCLLLLYALTSAYIAGASSLLKEVLQFYFRVNVPGPISAILFVLILGSAVFWSTKATDYLNRGLISIKGFLLFVTILFLAPNVDFASMAVKVGSGDSKYLFAVLPILMTAFGYHTVVPSIRVYFGDKPQELRRIIIWATSIALVIYLVWVFIVLNIIPLVGANSFEQIATEGTSVGGLAATIAAFVSNKWVIYGFNGFSNVAMTTSFLGVTLGLFDFVADGFKRPDTRFGRLQTAGLTFIPPLIFGIYYPRGFILALSYAALFVTILEVILPAIMAYKLRYSKRVVSQPYRVFGGKWLLFTVAACGITLIIIQILLKVGMLPGVD